MPLDFPASPTDGQIYGNWVYSTVKGAWKAKPLTPGQAQISATAPANPNSGDQWYNSNDGVLYIYYNDGNTSQWVESRSAITSDGYYSPNYIINGAFEINQRAFTSTTTPGAFTFDRWYPAFSGSTVTCSSQTFTPGTISNAQVEPTNYVRIVQSGATGAGNYVQYDQKIEDVRTLAGQSVTVSFWARVATGTAVVGVNLTQDFGTGGSAYVDYYSTVTVNSSWTRYSVQFNLLSTTGKTIGSSSNVRLALWTSAGSSYTGLFGNALGLQNNTFEFWGVQVEQGVVAMPFRRNANSIQGELAACQRYYIRFVDVTGVRTVYGSSVWQASTVNNGIINLPVQMRRTPTVTASSAGALLLLETGIAWRSSTSIAQDAGTNQNCIQLSVGTTSTAGYAHASQIAVQNGQYLEVNAEL